MEKFFTRETCTGFSDEQLEHMNEDFEYRYSVKKDWPGVDRLSAAQYYADEILHRGDQF